MELTGYFVLLTRLGVGAVTTFLAILLWSQTRDVSWVLAVVAATVDAVGPEIHQLGAEGRAGGDPVVEVEVGPRGGVDRVLCELDVGVDAFAAQGRLAVGK